MGIGAESYLVLSEDITNTIFWQLIEVGLKPYGGFVKGGKSYTRIQRQNLSLFEENQRSLLGKLNLKELVKEKPGD
jgi:hypothetical protein